VTEITSPEHWQRYEDKELVAEGDLPWGFLPVVHIQNIAQPYYYEGVSDVEPLIPLQDELNTRLSDRASRITFQSFKMYLGKGIEGFEEKPVSPGRMWHTDNPDASIQEFGGDAAAPSEDLHIAEIREALDKTSGVTPVMAGILKDRLGNLTSAVALRLTFLGMLSKNERKRHTYSEGLKKICRMALSILDTANVYQTDEQERDVDVVFASPLPEDTMTRLQEAQIKRELGVPAEQVLKELGYGNDRCGCGCDARLTPAATARRNRPRNATDSRSLKETSWIQSSATRHNQGGRRPRRAWPRPAEDRRMSRDLDELQRSEADAQAGGRRHVDLETAVLVAKRGWTDRGRPGRLCHQLERRRLIYSVDRPGTTAPHRTAPVKTDQSRRRRTSGKRAQTGSRRTCITTSS
jgi:hypothetical protein